MQFNHCISKQLDKLRSSTKLQMGLGNQCVRAMDAIAESSMIIPHYENIPFSTSTAAIILVASCIAPARN